MAVSDNIFWKHSSAWHRLRWNIAVVSKGSWFGSSKWWVMAFVLVLFTTVGCSILTSAITSRNVGAADRDELDYSRLAGLRATSSENSRTGLPSDPSSRYTGILTPLAVQGASKQAVPIVAAPTVPSSSVEAVPTKSSKTVLRLPDVTPTIKPTPTPAPPLAPTPQIEAITTEESKQEEPVATISEDVPTPEPLPDCIRSGGMTLWLEPSGGQWTVPVGQSIEIKLCLSNISTDLAGFDVLLELGSAGTAEFREVSMGGFGLETHSELPTESLRIRAIDLKKRLTEGSAGVVLATMQLVGIAAGESPMTIDLNAIDDTEGESVAAQSLDSSLLVTVP